MLFNSIDFAFFLPLVFILYWVLNKNLKFQNLLIIISSYLFYGWWDWRFLSLILFSTFVDYSVGVLLHKQINDSKRKILLWFSVIVNLGFLGFFKYYNFFLENFVSAFSLFGVEINHNTLNIILPVGISFYTFQTLSYTIDVYKKKLEPTKDVIAFAAFVCFFPQLVAGPIERATSLLPQFYKKRVFKYHKAVDGLRQILWGLFKKIVIADNCAQLANEIFNNSSVYSGSTLALGAIFFTFQIYGDFSGYSDIAIGTSKLFGFELMSNFKFPYFSRNIGEFWRRWHISLSTWFRDYLYIPLGGNRKGELLTLRNLMLVFLLTGLWHGASWTFVIWGIYHGVFLLIERLGFDKLLNFVYKPIRIAYTLLVVMVGWVLFRSKMFFMGEQNDLKIYAQDFLNNKAIFVLLIAAFLAFGFGRWVIDKLKATMNSGGAAVTLHLMKSVIAFSLLLLSILYLAGNTYNPFIYFRF